MLETAATFVSVLVVNSILADGKSNWLEGAMLLGSYVILALAFLATIGDNSANKQQIRHRFNGRSSFAVILGTIGITIEDSVDSVPTPNVPNSGIFADEPVQSNPLATFISANAILLGIEAMYSWL